MKSRLLGEICVCLSTLGMVASADAALLSRLGGAAGYDTVLNITWTTDANLSGKRGWGELVTWASGLSIGGLDSWRLTSMNVGEDGAVVQCATATEAACRDNELGYMYYHILNGSNCDDLRGTQTLGDVTLSEIQHDYWSGTNLAGNPTNAWAFHFDTGNQAAGPKAPTGYGWAVADGDVFASTVPIPAAAWLFGSGLMGLIGIARKKAL